MQLEVEYDQLKHQISSRHSKPTSSPGTSQIELKILNSYFFFVLERSTFQYDFPPPPPPVPMNKPPPAPPLPQSLKQNDYSPKVNEGK